ncbi:DUF6901 family protein [Rosettibacter firmus]|uniref:DUF6901 family protein n=1 Tax=Rosettibacter firmus TaxID=3111522 RepID=UPI00336BC307
MENNQEVLKYTYTFIFNNGTEKKFEILLDKNTLDLISSNQTEVADWAKRENFQCANDLCNSKFEKYCPIAVNIDNIIKFFSDINSYETVKIYAEVDERTYFKETSVQKGVSSLIGIIMPVSGCPVLSKLKPLVRFHLPFASIEETEFRVISMYLFVQYMIMQRGGTPDWEMKKLKQIYEDILKINRVLSERVANLENKDASINAIVALDNFAQFISSSLEYNDLSDFENIFKEWLE